MRWLALGTFLFYSLNVTGFKVKKFVLVDGSCIKSEPIDMVYWVLYLASLIVFWIKPEIGQWFLLGFLTIGVLTLFLTTGRYMIWPNEKKIQGYNNWFATSHHLIKPSTTHLIPDTFHIGILLFIPVNIIGMILYIVIK